MTEAIPVFGPAQLEAALDGARDVQVFARDLTIASDAQLATATQLRADIRDEREEIESMRTEALAPLVQSQKTIRGWFAPVLDALSRADVLLRDEIGRYVTEAKHAQAAAFAAAEQAYTDGDHRSALVSLAESSAETSVPRGTSVREVWRAEVVEPDAVPREWCVPDARRIAAEALHTRPSQEPRAIPGVLYSLVPYVTARRVRP